jgi:hypothetical protein
VDKKPSLSSPKNDYIKYVVKGIFMDKSMDVTIFKSKNPEDFKTPQDFIVTYTELAFCKNYFDGKLMYITDPDSIINKSCTIEKLPIYSRLLKVNKEDYEQYQQELRNF